MKQAEESEKRYGISLCKSPINLAAGFEPLSKLLQLYLSWKTCDPIGHKKWFLKTGDLWWQIQLYRNVGQKIVVF